MSAAKLSGWSGPGDSTVSATTVSLVPVGVLAGDQAGALQLGRRAIRGLQRDDGLRLSFIPYVIACALAATRPHAAAIIQGAAGRGAK
jgi:hypothetical protein